VLLFVFFPHLHFLLRRGWPSSRHSRPPLLGGFFFGVFSLAVGFPGEKATASHVCSLSVLFCLVFSSYTPVCPGAMFLASALSSHGVLNGHLAIRLERSCFPPSPPPVLICFSKKHETPLFWWGMFFQSTIFPPPFFFTFFYLRCWTVTLAKFMTFFFTSFSASRCPLPPLTPAPPASLTVPLIFLVDVDLKFLCPRFVVSSFPPCASKHLSHL